MKGHRSQRGSRSRQTGGTVLRLHRPGAYWWQSSLHRAPTAADARIGRRVRWWPLSLCLGGPGEPSGGSVRPRGRPLRPDGVRTAPMRAWTDPRDGKGVKNTNYGTHLEILCLKRSQRSVHSEHTFHFLPHGCHILEVLLLHIFHVFDFFCHDESRNLRARNYNRQRRIE